MSISEGQESPFHRYNCCLQQGEIENYAQVVRGQNKGWLTSQILLGVTKAYRVGELSGVLVSRCCATLQDSECGLEIGADLKSNFGHVFVFRNSAATTLKITTALSATKNTVQLRFYVSIPHHTVTNPGIPYRAHSHSHYGLN